jgi:beta-aspartyl-dipeptidase (metallo-type)
MFFMITIIKDIELFTPKPSGKKDLLLANDRIAAIADQIDQPANFPAVTVFDGEGMLAVPGFIDSHVHIMGGGGEAGFATRTPEMRLSQATSVGVTSVIGVRGTDGISRSMEGFVAKARGLKEEGISCWVLTGSYQVPVLTITERIESDIMMISEVIGVGEIAISDHRSSQPTFEELAKIASAARVGGMLSGKAGVISVHLGDGPNGLALIKELVQKTEIPYRQFVPTHMNRNPDLFEEGLDYARNGGRIDLTTSTTPQFLSEGETKCSQALRICLNREIPIDHITLSSDGQGSMPDFDANGDIVGYHVGTCSSLFSEVRDAVQQEDVPLDIALKAITENPAKTFKLPRKGQLLPGYDADLVLLDPQNLTIQTVFSRGKLMVQRGEIVVKGMFE